MRLNNGAGSRQPPPTAKPASKCCRNHTQPQPAATATDFAGFSADSSGGVAVPGVPPGVDCPLARVVLLSAAGVTHSSS